MKKFRNELSWSKSRDELFRECRRKYYYAKYGFWDGWFRDADPLTREIYALKQVKSSRMWLGSCVHDAIEGALKGLQRGEKVAQDEILDQMTERMRRDFRMSKEGKYRSDPKRICALFEHVYEIPVSDEAWKQIHETAKKCVVHFFDSQILKRALNVGSKQWYPIEEMQSFLVDGVKVYVKLDFAFREGDEVVIVDWKTGQGEDVDVSVQLGCYALYASQHWNIDPKNVQAIEMNVNTLKETTLPMMDARIEWVEHYIRNSISAMKALLRDVPENKASIEDFDQTDDLYKCRWCNFRKVCRPEMN
jgi:hypothetical protein